MLAGDDAVDRDRLDCRLFVDAPVTPEELAGCLMAGESPARLATDGVELTVVLPTCEIDMGINEYWQPQSTAWMEFRYSLELYRTGTATAEHVQLVGRLLGKLWGNGWSATAACDYEDVLPDQGSRTIG